MVKILYARYIVVGVAVVYLLVILFLIHYGSCATIVCRCALCRR